MACKLRLPVLLVEANETLCDTLRMVLEERGFVVDEAPDSITALACLRGSLQRLVVVLDLWRQNMHARRVLEAVAADASLTSRHAYLLLTDYDSRPLPPVVSQLLATPHTVVLIKRFSPE